MGVRTPPSDVRRHSWELGRNLQISRANLPDNASGTLEERISFGYDRAGNRTAKVAGNQPEIAHFNDRNQLITGDYEGSVPLIGHLNEWAEVEITTGSDSTFARLRKDATAGYLFESSLELDPDGTTDFSIDATDINDNTTEIDAQYVVSGTGDWVALTYDDNGNTLTRSLTPTSGEVFTYHWDRENRLVKVERSAGPTTAFVYNAFGERVKIIEDADGTPIERRFIHSGAEILQERDASNVVVRNYYPQGEERLDEAGDPQYFYTRDHLGNVRELIKKADGSIVGRWDYSPYGIREDLIGGAGSVECEFGFTGHFTHEDSALVLTYFRGYLPELGRWLSPDPIGELGPDGANLYGYVGSNPINMRDPHGEFGLLGALVGGGLGAITGALVAIAREENPWKGALTGAVGGAVFGGTLNPQAGTAAAALVSGIVAGTAGGAASGVVGEVWDAIDPCEDARVSDILESTLWGAAGGALAGPLSKYAGELGQASWKWVAKSRFLDYYGNYWWSFGTSYLQEDELRIFPESWDLIPDSANCE